MTKGKRSDDSKPIPKTTPQSTAVSHPESSGTSVTSSHKKGNNSAIRYPDSLGGSEAYAKNAGGNTSKSVKYIKGKE